MTTKIYVISHKNTDFPEEDIYEPLIVGGGLSEEPYLHDNTGDSISCFNSSFCELTGIYWIWKNTDTECVGIAHYHRFPVKNGRLLGEQDIGQMMRSCDIILPRERRYFIESNYSHYAHAHHIEDMDMTRQVIAERHPDYLTAFDRRMRMTRGHRCNMFIMKRKRFDEYCSWLFDILFELRCRIDISDYDPYNRRVFGFISERLLDVWLDHNGYSFSETKVLDTEGSRYISKAAGMIKRKIKNRK